MIHLCIHLWRSVTDWRTPALSVTKSSFCNQSAATVIQDDATLHYLSEWLRLSAYCRSGLRQLVDVIGQQYGGGGGAGGAGGSSVQQTSYKYTESSSASGGGGGAYSSSSAYGYGAGGGGGGGGGGGAGGGSVLGGGSGYGAGSSAGGEYDD